MRAIRSRTPSPRMKVYDAAKEDRDQLTVYLPSAVKRDARAVANSLGLSLSDFVSEAVTKAINNSRSGANG